MGAILAMRPLRYITCLRPDRPVHNQPRKDAKIYGAPRPRPQPAVPAPGTGVCPRRPPPGLSKDTQTRFQACISGATVSRDYPPHRSPVSLGLVDRRAFCEITFRKRGNLREQGMMAQSWPDIHMRFHAVPFICLRVIFLSTDSRGM